MATPIASAASAACTLRRHLVEGGLLARTRDGSSYRRVG
ncbi:DUF2087 domain-containing protein [Streptomyces sp. S8]|nr:DUF2087 domain-containing protein [Streptomyces sp. S8]